MNDDNYNENYELTGRVLNEDLRPTLAGFIGQALSKFYGWDWWQRGVLDILKPEQRRGLPKEGNYASFTDAMDVQLCKVVINAPNNWKNIFQNKLDDNQRAWVNEVAAIRNDWAHRKIKKFSNIYVIRAFDTMILLCDTLDKEVADNLRAQEKKFRAQYMPSEEEDADDYSDQLFFTLDIGNVSWREVMEPNRDVREGTFKNSEFAADLGAVAAGTSPMEEYQNATKFFARTYMTAGMRRLLMEALGRLVRGDGEPLIEVKTSFGGGKTHSMMALFHLFKRKYDPLKVDKSVQDLLIESQIVDIPKDIHTAVVVGVKVNTEREKDIPELEGVKAHTLMGEIFSQLARSAGRFDLYQKHIQLNDERGVSPGVDDLCAFLDGVGACLILLDELVLYGKKLYRGADADRNKFDQFIAFLQELTEAIRMSKRSMLVASLPQSESEIGIGDGGQEVLRSIEHHFGRLQSVWTPVEAQESFEIVRRRLFQPCMKEALRDEICESFATMYKRDKTKLFPMSAREARYLNRLKACYPLHPQIFDLLYDKWATIESFQRTRGVLRLVAAIVHELWKREDRHSMIMTGAIPIFESGVRNELLRYIGISGNWGSIIDNEIDGENSEPRKLETSDRSVQLHTARRVTRTIFMGSAPSARGQNVRGLNIQEIMLGVLTPQDKKDSQKFKNALEKLKTKLTYLYFDDMYYWFDGRPTLRKLAEEYEQNVADEDIRLDIIDALKADFEYKDWFKAKHITSDHERVPDVASVQLVILPPEIPFFKRSNEPSKVYDAAEAILNWGRNENPRLNKNMLIFLAGDGEGLKSLSKLLRSCRAWKKLSGERDQKNFDRKQIAEIEKNISELEEKARTQLFTAYNHLIEPTVRADDMKEIEWQEIALNCSASDNISVIGERLRSQDSLLLNLSAEILTAELYNYVFKKDRVRVSLNQLWDYMAQYIYMLRIYDRRVLLDAVVEGVQRGLFGLAEAFDEESGEYTDLVMNELIKIGSMDQLLVEREEAEAHLHVEKQIVEPEPIVDELPKVGAPYVEPDPKRFSATFDLNVDNPSRDVNRVMNEIADILNCLEGAAIKLSLELEGRVPDGIPEPEREALKQNCKMLRARIVEFK